MTPLSFEQMYQDEWAELEAMLDSALGRKPGRGVPAVEVSGARLAALYRRACEHLALARARAYPAYLVDRLERMTSNGHQLIYQRREFGLDSVKAFARVEFPRTVRAHRCRRRRRALTFALPTLVVGVLVYHRPELILSLSGPRLRRRFKT